MTRFHKKKIALQGSMLRYQWRIVIEESKDKNRIFNSVFLNLIMTTKQSH